MIRRGPFRAGSLAAALALSAPAALADSATFAPERFFAGRSEGVGIVRTPFGQRSLRVESLGRVEPDGTIVLDQSISQGEDKAETRQWRLRRVAADRYSGTLSDAAGPVTGQVKGRVLNLSFFTRFGLEVDQRIILQPGDQVALNRMRVRFLGVQVGSVEERISRR